MKLLALYLSSRGTTVNKTLARRAGEGKISRAPQHLIDHYNRDGRRHDEGTKTQDAQGRQNCQGKGRRR